jgi:hypothetical protein
LNNQLKVIGLSAAMVFQATGPSTPSIFAGSPMDLGRSPVTYAQDTQFKSPDFHGWDPLGADCAWFREFKRPIDSDPIDPNSDSMLARLRNANGTIDSQWSGPWTDPTWNWYTFPLMVVSGNTPYTSVPGTWSYNPTSNGPYMFPPEPVVYEGYTLSSYPTTSWTDGGDHHLIVYVRDEATGGPKELWEYYQPWITKNGNNQITAVAGASWRKFNLRDGETPIAGTSTTDAAGMMISPLLVRYDEVASGAIHHALRFAVNNTDISPTFKWPARTAAGAWNPATGMPYGTRIRIKQSWWNTNANSVLGINTQARIFGEALRRYGAVLADGSGGSTVQLGAVADLRWDADLHSRLNSIPVTALEVVQTPPMWQVNGPASIQVGVTGTWTITTLPAESPVGNGSTFNLYDPNGQLIAYIWMRIDDTHRSRTASYSFPSPGVYSIQPYEDWYVGPGGKKFLITVTTSTVPPPPDVLPPAILSLGASNITETAATITWSTDENSDAQVEYGLDTTYQNTSPLNSFLTTAHSVNLIALTPGTLYHYCVKSKDSAGNLSISSDQMISTLAVNLIPPNNNSEESRDVTFKSNRFSPAFPSKKIMVFERGGKLVRKFQGPGTSQDLNGLATGVYAYKTEGENVVHKLLIVR